MKLGWLMLHNICENIRLMLLFNLISISQSPSLLKKTESDPVIELGFNLKREAKAPESF